MSTWVSIVITRSWIARARATRSAVESARGRGGSARVWLVAPAAAGVDVTCAFGWEEQPATRASAGRIEEQRCMTPPTRGCASGRDVHHGLAWGAGQGPA